MRSFPAAVAAFILWGAFAGTTTPNADGDSPGSFGGDTTGDPVGYVDGTVYETEVDLRIACPGLDLVFRRHYDSQTADASTLGAGWVHGYESYVADRNGGVWVYLAGESGASDSIRRFPSLAPGGCAFDESGDELCRSEDGSYELVTPDRLRYAFNSAGRLSSITSWGGMKVTLERETPRGPVVRVGHSCGRFLSFSYADGLLVRVDSPDSAVFVELAYSRHGDWDILSRVVRHDGPRASTNAYSYVSIPAPGTRRSSDTTFLSPMLSVASSEAGIATLRPVLSRRTGADGLSAYFTYVRPDDSQAVRCTHMEMDGGLLATTLTFGDGFTVERRPVAGGVATTRLEYDRMMRETLRRTGAETVRRTYGPRGELVQIVRSDSSTGGRHVRTLAYDESLRVVRQSDALGGGSPQVTHFTWDDELGIPSRTVSPEGRISSWTAEGSDFTVFGAGEADPRLVTRVSCTADGRPLSVTGPDGGVAYFDYGVDGLVSVISQDGLPSVAFARDLLGNVISETSSGPDGNPRVTVFERNWRGRPIAVTHPDGTVESFEYDGGGTRVVRHVDALGREDLFKWVLGLPVHVGRVVDGVTNGLFSVSHDPQLNVVAIRDPLGRLAESYVLDGNERIVAVTNLEGRVATRRYLLGGLVASETRFDGTAVEYGYDASGRLASAAYPGGTLRFAWDADGLLLAASGGAGAVSNAWDAATGWLDATVGADGTRVAFGRSDGGAVTSVTSVAGTERHALDAAGRRVRTDSPAGTVAYAYCPWNGLVSSVTLPGGVTASYAYDVMDRVTNVAWRTVGGESLGGIAYEYDALGRITARSLALGNDSFDRAYSYDGRDRLASDGGVAYRYDAAGNRLAKVGDAGGDVAYTLGTGDRLAAWTDGAYGYDAAGCVTRIRRGGDVLDLAWDGLYRLVSVATNGVSAESYAYDALGRRTATTTAEGTERHVWDGDHCLADVDEEGNVLRAYLWGPGVDNLLAVRVGGRNYAALTDIQGTVWGYADERGETVARWTYDAWGNVLSEEIAESAEALRSVRYRFQGREFSRATGLTNFRARWYDPVTGRWLSKDPIRLNGGLNLYAFCGNDPIHFIDPRGCGKFGAVVRIGRVATKWVKQISRSEAKRLYKKGGKDIGGSNNTLKKWSKCKGEEIVGPESHKGGRPHCHTPNRNGAHGFLYSLTAVGLFGDNIFSQILDCINPISDIVDGLDLIDEYLNDYDE